MKILGVAKGQKRSILEVCEHFGICSKVQNLPIRTIFSIFVPLMDIQFYNEECNYRLPQKRLMRKWLREVAKQEGNYSIAEISYVFCSAERHRAMNIEFLGHDYFTDIITFDDSDLKDGYIAGDIFIDIETVADNARLYGATAKQEMLRVIVHGVLHLCGQKDKTPRAEKQMHRKEDKYLALLDELNGELKAENGKL